ncbi:non-ribosomal peptide synthetase [Teredinibacter turnerae]|uniref:non-ribosomal peptide synthetase n=1 Tax=Teredinibacter turnerae TaxID=2426 RepID=UPI0003768219|nr:non-ribosomal peptide synthetase [Teredinibacter turnerae]
MSMFDLLASLHEKKIRVTASNGQLKIDAPKGAIDQATLESLKKYKYELVEYFESANKSNTIITARDRTQNAVLSYAQQRLWLVDKMEGGSTHYNVSSAFNVEGDYNLEFAERAFTTIVQRHEALRTVFIDDSEHGALQKVVECDSFNIQLLDFSAHNRAESDKIIGECATREAQTPFDLSRDLMLRVSYLRFAQKRGVLLFSIHHIATDAWSLGILVNEFAECYRAISGNVQPTLSQLPIQYADYAAWQRSWLSGERLQQQFDYWQRQLADLPKEHKLPLDYPRPEQQSYAGVSYVHSVPEVMHQKLSSLANDTKSSLFMVLHAAFSLLVYRHSNSADVVIGTPVANRTQKALEDIIGCFVNNLVLRLDCGESESFVELLGRAKKVNLEAQSHQDIQFDQVVERINPVRSTQHSPLFQIMLSMNTNESFSLSFSGCVLSQRKQTELETRYDLILYAIMDENGLSFNWVYNKALFVHETIERLAGHWVRLLGNIAENPQENIQKISILSDEEKSNIFSLNDITQKSKEDSREVAHFLSTFAQQVAMRPDACAVVCGPNTLSYRELDKRSNQIANYLIERGIAPGDRVGIYLERTNDMVSSVVGVFKASAAFVALDPSYPVKRLEYMLADSDCKYVLTSKNLKCNIAEIIAIPMCEVDQCENLIAVAADAPAISNVDPALPAYMVYTSGTTGTPKGVPVSHCNLAAYLSGLLSTYKIEEGLRYGVLATIATDLGHTALFTGLVTGGELHLIDEDCARNAEAFMAYVQSKKLEFFKLTPNHFNALFPTECLAQLSFLKWLVIGGESASTETVQKLSQLVKHGTSVVNHYGPTEGTIGSTTWQLGATYTGQTMPVGRPLPHVQTYILNRYMELVPDGTEGELHIGGQGVVNGYHNRSELTCERFLTNPFGEGRLYKTGDRVRRSKDGNIVFLGRVDNQVKLRGYRIELQEVESCLASLEGISAAAVKITEDQATGSKRISAYVVFAQNTESKAAEFLLQELALLLPEYMVPATLAVVDRMPLTANGKIDRTALPDPEASTDTNSYVAPVNHIEKLLVEIWAKILKVEASTLSTTANFFESGGDSILSILMISQAAKTGLSITPKSMMAHQTIQSLAPHVVEKNVNRLSATSEPAKGSQILLPVQHRFFEHRTDMSHYNQSVLLSAAKEFSLDQLTAIVSELLQKHDVFRLRFNVTYEAVSAEYVPFTNAILSECVENIHVNGFGDTAFSEHLDTVQRSLSISDGPLIRFVLFSAESEAHSRLLIACNHLAIDGVSWRILLSDLAHLQQIQGNDAAVAQWRSLRTETYQAWGKKLSDFATTKKITASAANWQHLAEAKAPETLNPSVAERAYHKDAVEIQFELDEPLTQALLKTAPNLYRASVQELLLTALTHTLSNIFHTAELQIDLEGHGREPALISGTPMDVSNTIGWFTSVYPVLISQQNTSIFEALAGVKDAVRAIEHGGVAFGVYKYLSHDESRIRFNTSPVIFNYLGQFDQVSDENGYFNLAEEQSGVEISPNRPLAYELNASAIISNNRLRFSLLYDSLRLSSELMGKLNVQLKASLFNLVEQCSRAANIHCSPSDFPLAYRQTEHRLQSQQLKTLRAAGYLFAVEGANDASTKVIEDIYPATAMQRGLLFHSAINQGSYVSQLAMDFSGPLELQHFKAAWEQVVARHAIFRTFFIGLDGDAAFQVVKSRVSLPFYHEDLTALSEAAQITTLNTKTRVDKEQGFDPEQAPLMRVTVFTLAKDRHRVLWSRHHALSDGWSSQQVFGEVTQAYLSLCAGQAESLQEVHHYSDYIAWLQKQDKSAAVAFWSEMLSEVHSPTQIGVAGVETDVQSDGHKREVLRLNESSSAALNKLAKSSKTTLATVVQAAWGYLLSRYSGDETVLFGETVSGRPSDLEGVETMVGLFINSLPVLVKIDNALTVDAWLKQLHRAAMDRAEHGFLPLGEIQQLASLDDNREMFSSLIVFESHTGNSDSNLSPAQDELHLQSYESDEYTHYDLTLCVEPGDNIEFRLEFNTRLYSSLIINQMLSHLSHLLHSFAEDRFQELADVELLTDQESHQLLAEWSSPSVEYCPSTTIHQRFIDQVARTPEAIAVTHNGASLTYAALDSYSDKIAGYLHEHGVGRGTLVAIYAYRSADFLAAILGIMKAGGAYVPLDPINPPERITYMIENSCAAVVITEYALAANLSLGESVTMLQLDKDAEAIQANGRQGRPDLETSGDDLAYMIYTSGSTGLPKGALVHHAGALNHIDAEFDVLGFMDNSGHLLPRNFLQSAASSSDVSVWQFLAPVVCGGKTVVLDDMTDLDNLTNLLQTEEVHLIQCAPVVLQLLVEYLAERPPEQRDLPELKWMMCIAEASSVKLVNRWLSLYPHVPIMNGYGPSEASDDVTYYIVDKPLPDSERNILIGKPLPNLSALVVDKSLRLQPMGVPGELCISGVGVGPGYWNNPEKTASAFVNNPFFGLNGVHGERMYRTGDLARWLPDGNLEFMGRLDNQTKVRGFRIELGEVEASLAKLPGVGEVAVLVYQDRQGKNALAAYVVWRGSEDFSAQDLRRQLAASLPDYMIPSTFTLMEKMPLTPADKIDRKALPKPQHESHDTYTAPQNDLERKLASLWEVLLGVPQVGREDNFFACGGDSILTIQLVSRARKAGIHLRPKQILESASLAELASVASDKAVVDAPQYPITGQQTWLPLQARWLASDQVDQHHYNQSVLLTIPETFNSSMLREFVIALYRKHDVLRLSLNFSEQHNPNGEYSPYQTSMVDAAVSVVSLSEIAEERKQEQLVGLCEQAQTSLSLTDGHLLKALLIDDASPENRRLLLVIHHLVVDGVSWRILKADLERAYLQMAEGLEINLGNKTSSFQRWSQDLKQFALDNLAAREQAYWANQDSIEVPALPFDHSVAAPKNASVESQTFRISESVSQALASSCHHAYQTSDDHLFLSAISEALNEWSGNRRFRIEFESHGRTPLLDHLDVSETLGWFTSTYPLVIELPELNNDDTLLVAVKEQFNAVPNLGIGYGFLAASPAKPAPIAYNNLGRITDGGASENFSLASENYGNEVSASRTREFPLSFTMQQKQGVWEITLRYSASEFNESTMAQLGERTIAALSRLVDHCQSRESRRHTPSDFSLAQVTQSQLDNWASNYKNFRNLYPSTPMQQGMLFHSALDSSAYCSQLILDLVGNLDLPAFRAAWQRVVARHDIFRTAFVGSEYLQLVVEEVSLPWNELDYRDMDDAARAQAFSEFQQADKSRGFDFTQPPLMRVTIIRFEETRYRVLWTNHHTLMDGWSLPIVFSEVIRNYQEITQTSSIDQQNHPDKGVQFLLDSNATPQYGRYIEWLASRSYSEAKTFWNDYLAGIDAPTTLDLLTREVMPENANSGDQQEYRTELDNTLIEQLNAFAKASKTTVNVLLQAAWAYLLHAYSGEKRVVFGETISGRPGELSGVEDIVGLFINSLPVSVSFETDMDIQTWLSHLHRDASCRSDHGYLSLSEIQASTGVAAGQDLFNTLLVVENFPVSDQLTSVEGLNIENVLADEQTNFDLTLVVYTGERISLNLRYSSGQYSESTLERLLRHFTEILTSLTHPSSRKISDIQILTNGEAQTLIESTPQIPGRNLDYVDPLKNVIQIQQMFEARARTSPGAVALRFQDDETGSLRELTYRELDEQANRLANFLRGYSIQPDVLVGICLERSPQMVISIIAVLKSGAAYVPLDPDYPQERLDHIVADSKLKLLITTSDIIERGRLPKCEITVSLNDECTINRLESMPVTAPELLPGNGENNLAYIIYTSGSTGKPKGVMVEHRNIIALMQSADHDFQFTAQDVWTLFHSFAFDFSVWEIWGALANGGRLLVVPKRVAQSTDDFYQLIVDERVTVLNQTPGAFEQLSRIDQSQRRALSLRYVVFGGEALKLESLRVWVNNHGDDSPAIINMYGITETTVHVTFRRILRADIEQGLGSPIGFPMSDMRVYILNNYLQPVPEGCCGEIFVSGRGVTRGYLHRDDLTAERFVKSPFEADQTLYRTGDIGRIRADGEVDYVGRCDNQVKVRGYRIELGEIEHQLMALRTVSSAVAVVHNQSVLLAYIVPSMGATTDVDRHAGFIEEIKSEIRRRLPEHMQPARYLVIPELPLTAHGKIDLRALPSPESFMSSTELLPLTTETERDVANIWAELLGIDCALISANASFFELGGHSLLLLKTVATINDAFGIELALREMLETPKLMDLAKKIETRLLSQRITLQNNDELQEDEVESVI